MPRHIRKSQNELLDLRHKLHVAVDEGGVAWAEAVGRMRACMGMTQAEFGRVFKLTVRQVAELENGKANPTAQTLHRLGKVFGYEVGFIRKRTPRP